MTIEIYCKNIKDSFILEGCNFDNDQAFSGNFIIDAGGDVVTLQNTKMTELRKPKLAHNEGGPAIIIRYDHGNLSEYYYLYGKEYDKQEFDIKVRHKKIKKILGE